MLESISTKEIFQRLIDYDLEQEASALNYEIMKHVETMDHLENNNDIIIILTSYPPLQEKFKARLDIEKTKKESDYAKSRELKKSEIATLNYFIVKNST